MDAVKGCNISIQIKSVEQKKSWLTPIEFLRMEQAFFAKFLAFLKIFHTLADSLVERWKIIKYGTK